MWNLAVATVSSPKFSDIILLKKVLGHSLNCWVNSRNENVADFLTQCFESKNNRFYYRIVRQLDFLLQNKFDKDATDAISKTAISLIPRLDHIYNFLCELEAELGQGRLQSKNNFSFRVKATSLIVASSWDYEPTLGMLDEFLATDKNAREKELILKELQYGNGKGRRTPMLPVILLDGGSELELQLLELVFSSREDSKPNGYDSCLQAAESLSIELKDLSQDFQVYVLSKLKGFAGSQPEFLRVLQYYYKVAEKWVNNNIAEKLFDSVISGKENYELDAHTLSHRPFLVDQPPWVKGDPEEALARNQAIMIVAGAKDYSRGFGQYTIAAKTLPDGKMAALERFGRDIFSCVSKVNAEDSSLFPGRGWLFSMPQTERFLAKNDADEILYSDPYKAWKEDWPFLADEIDIFHKSQVLKLRGLIVFHNLDQKFNYFNNQYCYVIFNDHFDRFEHQAAVAVPWRIIEEIVNPCLNSKITDQAFSHDIADINKQGLTLEYLQRRCTQLDLPFLNLTWPSNLGGMCNAFPSCSRFYHSFENALHRGYGNWWDFWGHPHKALIDNDWHPNGVPVWKELLYKPLQKAHKEVFDMALSYQNIAHLYKIAFSFWQKGFCDSIRGEIGQPFLSAKPTNTEVQARNDFLKLYLMREAHRWHKAGMQKNIKSRDFPVLGIHNVFQASSAPENGFSLDTYSMQLRLNLNGNIISHALNPVKLTPDDQQFWLTNVAPIFEDVTKAPNFFSRATFDDLPSII